jgi:thiamine transport system permease protein
MDPNLDRLHPALKKSTPFQILWVIPLLFLAVFFFYPLITILRQALSSNLLLIPAETDRIIQPLSFTFGQAILSAGLTLVIGLPATFLFVKYSFSGKTFLRVLTTVPFILPTVVVAAGFNAMLGPRGWINLALMNIFRLNHPPIHFLNTIGAILLAHVFYNTTIIIRIVGTAWSGLNPRLEQAANSLGASPQQVFLRVTIPLLLPSIISALLLVFLFDFTSFGVILLMGGPSFSTLETEIYTQAIHLLNLPLAAVLSTIQLISTLITTVCIMRFSSRWLFTLTPNFRREDTQTVKSTRSRLFVFFMSMVLVMVFILPILSLVMRSFIQIQSNTGASGALHVQFTSAYFKELFVNKRDSLFYIPPFQAIVNSLIYANLTMIIALFLGVATVFASRTKNRINRLLDPVIMLPLGTSAVTLGLGYVLVLSKVGLNLPSYSLIIPIVHSLVAFPFVVRTLQPALSAIPDSLHMAAATLGATPLRIIKEIDFPILARSIVTAGIFSFAISLGEFGATLFLSRPEFPTIPIAIYRFLSQPGALNYGQAMAMATILLVLCASSILILEMLNKKKRNSEMV